MERDTLFALYEITNGHYLKSGESKSKDLGCTGELSVETEVNEVELKCEGRTKKTKSFPKSEKIKFVGHVPREILREMFGINTNGMKAGVYKYGADSLGSNFTLTFDAYDLDRSDTLLLAFPVCSLASGFQLSLKNGESEVAEIELEINVGLDENGAFHYEAFKSEATAVAAKWHEKFDPKTMKA